MKDLRWKKISSEYISKDIWGTVRKDVCQTAEGKIISPYLYMNFLPGFLRLRSRKKAK